MTYEDFTTFMEQLKYDKKYAEGQILGGEWNDLVNNMFWNKPYHITYLPRALDKCTEFVEFLDGNGFIVKPIYYHFNGAITVDINPE